jgi:Transposase DDE domain
VLDSTPLYDAVATMDTVTLVRSAIRGLLAAAGDLEAGLRGLLARDDDYAAAGKPACDYEDPAAREALVDALARDARALLAALDGQELSPLLAQAAALVATVTGQDLDQGADGVFRIARRVARDRIISTVDPEARHGHKTSARGFDGYKGHVGIAPDAELITATAVTPGNAGDAAAAAGLLAADLPAKPDEAGSGPAPATDAPATAAAAAGGRSGPGPGEAGEATAGQPAAGDEEFAVYGDAAYGAGELLDTLEQAGADIYCKVQPPVASGGRFTKDAFSIDLPGGAVTCPAGRTAPLRPAGDGRAASFGAACAACPLASRCTTAKDGRSVWVGPYEEQLARARARQRDPDWKAGYTATRPKVERKIGHLMRRRHGGRRARVRGRLKVAADFALLAAAVNLARLGVLGVAYRNGAWAAGGG